MSSRTAHRLSLVFALLILALTVLSATQPAAPVCGDLANGYTTIIAFELARSVADLHAIFGDVPGACRTAIAHQMDSINVIDSFAFIQIYGAFLIFFFLGARTRNVRIANVAVVLTILACLADHVENFALFHISHDPDSTKWIPLLIGATETKWVGLGIVGALAIPLYRGSWLGWIAVPLCGAGLVVTLLTIPSPTLAGPYASNAIALGWLLFLAIDLRESFRRV
jgi:hypothetical protein